MTEGGIGSQLTFFVKFDPTDRVSYVYILASSRNGTLYTGVTSDLLKRIYQHREGLTPGFTSKYGVKRLVGYEEHGAIEEAIAREKVIKRWRRAWKLRLIEAENPQWLDLWDILHAAVPPEPRNPPTLS